MHSLNMPRYGVEEDSEDEFHDAQSDLISSPNKTCVLDIVPERDTCTEQINNFPDAIKPVSEQKEDFSNFLNNRKIQGSIDVFMGVENLDELPSYEDSDMKISMSDVIGYEKLNHSQLEMSKQRSYSIFKINPPMVKDTTTLLSQLGDIRSELEDSMAEISSIREMLEEAAQVISMSRISSSILSLPEFADSMCHIGGPVPSAWQGCW